MRRRRKKNPSASALTLAAAAAAGLGVIGWLVLREHDYTGETVSVRAVDVAALGTGGEPVNFMLEGLDLGAICHVLVDHGQGPTMIGRIVSIAVQGVALGGPPGVMTARFGRNAIMKEGT